MAEWIEPSNYQGEGDQGLNPGSRYKRLLRTIAVNFMMNHQLFRLRITLSALVGCLKSAQTEAIYLCKLFLKKKKKSLLRPIPTGKLRKKLKYWYTQKSIPNLGKLNKI